MTTARPGLPAARAQQIFGQRLDRGDDLVAHGPSIDDFSHCLPLAVLRFGRHFHENAAAQSRHSAVWCRKLATAENSSVKRTGARGFR